ncbi:hypothetical protein BCIN_10g03570 [Botrytis cinerea B05.10]|uniref:Uncharacterized protein n=1 Tax=Botryotinia fuckeliana (strain B05.10) TaxID=332648 RepID=A0A384JUT1_BOTFB|nr:hypothetical protein BCIN_10g03570 [Botrytis cinerea B05.10]ATZ54349.1 hypothetical protein BCIN_10g03570 [Botrytis cinerea B05.10]
MTPSLPFALFPFHSKFVPSMNNHQHRHLCVQLLEPFQCSLAERIFSFRAKIKHQIPSLPNTFSQYSMRQWCMTKGLQIKSWISNVKSVLRMTSFMRSNSTCIGCSLGLRG